MANDVRPESLERITTAEAARSFIDDQIKEIKDENGKVTSKVVPSSEARNTTDKTYYQNTDETAASGTTYSYEELPEAERIEYELDENTLVKIDTPVAVNTVNKEKKVLEATNVITPPVKKQVSTTNVNKDDDFFDDFFDQ